MQSSPTRSGRKRRARAAAALASIALLTLATGACSPTDPGAAAGVADPSITASGDDPCALLSAAEVRRVLPGAQSGQRDHRADGYGFASCVWNAPEGRLAIQTSATGSGPAREILDLVVAGNLDPSRPGAGETIRYEALHGIGDEAVAVVEAPDEARGILAAIAAVGVRRGPHDMVLMSTPLAHGDRAVTLKMLADLAHAGAQRL